VGLKLTLKANERAIVGGAVIRNNNSRPVSLVIENEIPVLREKRIISSGGADTPAKRLYFTIQMMYVELPRRVELNNIYVSLIADLAREAPSMRPRLSSISEAVINGDYYEALRLAWLLINYERDLISNAELRLNNV
jgi:flagellar protein FlbT